MKSIFSHNKKNDPEDPRITFGIHGVKRSIIWRFRAAILKEGRRTGVMPRQNEVFEEMTIWYEDEVERRSKTKYRETLNAN
jgi:hypothetical protein